MARQPYTQVASPRSAKKSGLSDEFRGRDRREEILAGLQSDKAALIKLARHAEAAIERGNAKVRLLKPRNPDIQVDLNKGIIFKWDASGAMQISVGVSNYISETLDVKVDWNDFLEEKDFALLDISRGQVSSSKYIYTFSHNFGISSVEVRPNADFQNEVSEDEKNNTKPTSLRPRWAEENRPKKQVKLRLPPDLIDQVDAALEGGTLNRNDWIEQVIQDALKPK